MAEVRVRTACIRKDLTASRRSGGRPSTSDDCMRYPLSLTTPCHNSGRQLRPYTRRRVQRICVTLQCQYTCCFLRQPAASAAAAAAAVTAVAESCAIPLNSIQFDFGSIRCWYHRNFWTRKAGPKSHSSCCYCCCCCCCYQFSKNPPRLS